MDVAEPDSIDALLADIAARHGREVAEVARRYIAGEVAPLPRVPKHVNHGWRVGKRDRPPKPIPKTTSPEPSWRDLAELRKTTE